MKLSSFAVAALTLSVLATSAIAADTVREKLSLDQGWRFALGNSQDPVKDFGYGTGHPWQKTGAGVAVAAVKFDDRAWREVTVPHDWCVELPFDSKADDAHGAKAIGPGYPETSVGWYRRAFEIPKSDLGKRLTVELDGVFRDSIVFLNGIYLGRHRSGYTPARYDITDAAHYGGRNVLTVRADASQFEGWFYEGAGIYRHTWLLKTDPVHVPVNGTFITSDVGHKQAVLHSQVEVQNDSDQTVKAIVTSTVVDAVGKTVLTFPAQEATVAPGSTDTTMSNSELANPSLWSPESPTLYKLVTTVTVGDQERDHYETTFGIRTLKWDADQGFFLNGKRVELKGTCNHQDHAGVGSALPDRLQDWRIEQLKAMGSNAIRTSHNMPTTELLDACDRQGMLVMDETRTFGSNPEALDDLRELVRRDRNRPSVFIWSLANEETLRTSDEGGRIFASMKRVADQLDGTRLTTAAMNGGEGKGMSLAMDVQGFNYMKTSHIDDFHKKFPQKPSIGTEEASSLATRGEYVTDTEKLVVSSYDVNAPRWGSTAEQWWPFYHARPFVAGAFVWTGFDYRGEPTPYHKWPSISSHFGILDLCGFPKDTFYYYQAWWGDKPMVHVLPHWNWTTGQTVDVWAYSNAESVDLLVNGKSAGKQSMPRDGHLSWKVPFEPGAIEARAYNGDQLVAQEKVESAGAPAKVVVEADRSSIAANGEDVSMVTVRVTDAEGRTVPDADAFVHFAVSGEGNSIGVGNGDPVSHESDKALERHVYHGLAQIILQSMHKPGTLTLKATAAGLAPGELSITTTDALQRRSVDVLPAFTPDTKAAKKQEVSASQPG